VKPLPVEPVLVESTPVDLPLVEPAPVGLAPVEPLPVETAPVDPPLVDGPAHVPGESFVIVTVTVSGPRDRASRVGERGSVAKVVGVLSTIARSSRMLEGVTSRLPWEGEAFGAFGALGPKSLVAWARPTTQAFLLASEAMA